MQDSESGFKFLTLWSHPPGSNRRPADYESLQNTYGAIDCCWIELDQLLLIHYVADHIGLTFCGAVGSVLMPLFYIPLYSFHYA
jgi:hypothetical protein